LKISLVLLYLVTRVILHNKSRNQTWSVNTSNAGLLLNRISFFFRFITQQSHKLEAAPRPPPAVTNAVSWRTEGLKYRKNEVFLDVIESVNLLVNTNGNVLRSEIVGSVKMKVFLTGMPELRLGLNDKILFENTGSKFDKAFILSNY